MEDATAEVGKFLAQLARTIHQRPSAQRKLRCALGWSRSYVGRLLARQSALRLEQLLLILRTFGVEPVEFFGELYQWPGGSTARAWRGLRPALDRNLIAAEVYFEVDRVLALLRQKVADSGRTQVEIQEPLGWGAGCVSRLLTRPKVLRVEQLLLILGVIEVEPRGSFAELCLPRASGAPRGEVGAMAGRGEEIEDLAERVRGLIRLLERKGLVTAAEVEAAGGVEVGAAGES